MGVSPEGELGVGIMCNWACKDARVMLQQQVGACEIVNGVCVYVKPRLVLLRKIAGASLEGELGVGIMCSWTCKDARVMLHQQVSVNVLSED